MSLDETYAGGCFGCGDVGAGDVGAGDVGGSVDSSFASAGDDADVGNGSVMLVISALPACGVCCREPSCHPRQNPEDIPLHCFVQPQIPELFQRQRRVVQSARGGMMVRSVDRGMNQIL